MNPDALDFVRRDPDLQLRMHAAYTAYMLDKGVPTEDVMTFDEWKEHFGL